MLHPPAIESIVAVENARLLAKLALTHFSQNEQARIRAAAHKAGVDVYALGAAIEAYKQENGLPPSATLGYRLILEIAKRLASGDYWSGVK